MRKAPTTKPSEREERLRTDLMDRFGPLMAGVPLYQALGFKSSAALRVALAQGRVKVRLFTPPGRRGKFALSEDVAQWLASCSNADE